MRSRKLGRTGYQVSELGIGAWGLGSPLMRGVDPQEAQRALYNAIDSGVNLVMTGPEHGNSEARVGEVIRDLRARDHVVVVTSVPALSGNRAAGNTADGAAGPGQDVLLERVFPAKYVVHTVEQSLRAQRAEVLVIAQFGMWRRTWCDSSSWHDLCGTMRDLIKAGKVLHWGVTIHASDSDPAPDERAPDASMDRRSEAPQERLPDEPLIETVNMAYNVFDQRGKGELFADARERDLGIMTCTPFDRGALAGNYTRDSTFLPGDARNHYFAGDRLARTVERVDALLALVGSEVATQAELALRFCLSNPDVSAVVAGMRRSAHVGENIAMCDGRTLSPELVERLRDHAWTRAPAP